MIKTLKCINKRGLFLLIILLIISILSCTPKTTEQATTIEVMTPENQSLYNILQSKDSLLFNLGYNNCDTAQIRQLVSDQFEFYHDQAGKMDSKANFIKVIAGLCKMPYQPIRRLVEGSMEVHPLYNNGEIYGAIQMGEHRFFAKKLDRPEYLTSTAKFTHLWILEEGEWRVTKVLSYNHQLP